MPRKVREAKLETRSARLRLEIRRKPYFVAVASGISLGYRRCAGAGSWSVRAADGKGGNWLKQFASADDFEEANGGSVLEFWTAQGKARELARIDETTNTERPATVREAIESYGEDLAARSADRRNLTVLQYHVPDTLAAKPVAMLTAKELRAWRNGMVKGGVKPATADRVARVFKAACNLAAADDARITNAKQWRDGLKRLPDGENARNIILSDEVVRDVVAAAYADDHVLGVFVDCLASTGARESQLLALGVDDIVDSKTAPRLMMPSSRKGKNRRVTRKPIAITPRLLLVLKQAAKGRNGKLFVPIYRVSDRFREATKHLELDPATTPYALRHSSIVRMLLAGTPVRVVAAHHDTGVAMIEQHYSKYIIGDPSDALTRKTLLDLDAAAAPSNVVAIR